MNIVEKAKQYAIACHRGTNHMYNDKPYEYHLQMVYDEAVKYSYLLNEDDREAFLAAAWTHDVIEDCRQTYNDVLKNTDVRVAEITYALTNEKGKNRRKRANKKYYKGIRAIPEAVLLKVCDRIANVKYSLESGSSMAKMYAYESNKFVMALYNDPERQTTNVKFLSAFADLVNLLPDSCNLGK